MQFQYLIDKINSAKFEDYPFSHIQINNLFNDNHLKQILAANEIAVPSVQSDEQLFSSLFEKGYKIINFPGCITDRDIYLKWHKDKSSNHTTNSACEGFGMTLRLMSPTSAIVSDLSEFMKGREFQEALAAKFGLDLGTVTYDTGIQKYLDGYEISPHPDIRRKALTYMVNINPDAQSEKQDHHTHYLTFRDEFKYVQAYWDGHLNEDRCWVPWTWCETKKVQRENNSMVIFAPKNDTMHGVKTAYNHLSGQRTQMYGNLWYKEVKVQEGPAWEDLRIGAKAPASSTTLKARVKAFVPASVKDLVKGKRNDVNVVADRLK
ncbi:hypothetical protein [Tunturiibacter lichenicola]|jgi:hypothetical protein|uniref:hypothetical protein n=1 Tax=Tunturiibacter lichenicola TaxID=2051959 RepID=UPI003D9B76A5